MQEQPELVSSSLQPLSGDEEDDEDYEPDYEPTEDAEQAYNVLDQTSIDVRTDQISLGHFEFPQSSPLNDYQLDENINILLSRMFDHVSRNETLAERKRSQPGLIGKKPVGVYGDMWTVLLIRLLTRGAESLDSQEYLIKASRGSDGFVRKQGHLNSFRERLYGYILEDFRDRMGVAMKWLNEEWYTHNSLAKSNPEDTSVSHSAYTRWTTRLLDGMLPYIDARDKIIIRFFSELPQLNIEVLERVKKLARDPDRAGLAVNLLLLVLLSLILVTVRHHG